MDILWFKYRAMKLVEIKEQVGSVWVRLIQTTLYGVVHVEVAR